MGAGPTRALTGGRRTKPTSTGCRRLRQPEPGRRSTYQAGEPVQTNRASSVAPLAAVWMTDALKAELAERIAAKRVLVVVGTGVSLAATGGEKLASWKDLIANRVERLVELGLRDAKWAAAQKDLLEGDINDLLSVAEQVSHRLGWKPIEPCGGDWNNWLRKTV